MTICANAIICAECDGVPVLETLTALFDDKYHVTLTCHGAMAHWAIYCHQLMRFLSAGEFHAELDAVINALAIQLGCIRTASRWPGIW